jgi:hypothetical protein
MAMLRLGHGRGDDGGVDLALAQRQEDVGLGLIGTELALAPLLDLRLPARSPRRCPPWSRRLLALHAFPSCRCRPSLRQDDVGEGEIGDREADGLGPLQRVGGRGDAHIGRPDTSAGIRSGKVVSTYSGSRPAPARSLQYRRQSRSDCCRIARAHGREVEHDGAAQHAGGNDVKSSLSAEEDSARWAQLNRQFHFALYKPCNRPYYLQVVSQSIDKVARYLRAQLVLTDGIERARGASTTQSCKLRWIATRTLPPN